MVPLFFVFDTKLLVRMKQAISGTSAVTYELMEPHLIEGTSGAKNNTACFSLRSHILVASA